MITRETLLEAVESACGNLTHAALILGVTRVHTCRLVQRHQLVEHARQLRQTHNGKAFGRPRRQAAV